MAEPITAKDIARYEEMINKQGVCGARTVYQELNSKGYTYAGWAYGVASGSTLTGQAALNFMQQTEYQKTGKYIPDNKVRDIRVDMAIGYLSALKNNVEKGNGITTTDVNFSQAREFHKEAFVDNGYSLDHWTLQTPMELIGMYAGGKNAQERAWQSLLKTSGDNIDAILESADLKILADQIANGFIYRNKKTGEYLPLPISNSSIDDIDSTPFGYEKEFVDLKIMKKASEWSSRVSAIRTGLGWVNNIISKDADNCDKDSDWNIKGSINPDVRSIWNNLYRYAAIRQYDPLTLDLDGDGIETVASNGHKGALFDHSNDGIRTATGWVDKDDGFLVYDRNGDGIVNNGSELFGDNTPLKNGERAANGYQALAELDDNGDGKVDAADSAFAKLRVWRDLNQDGISQEGELLTLEEAKVKALNLANKNTDRDLGNGNTLAEEGSYTDSDGNEKQMGDLNLAADHFHSRFSDSITLTDEQQQTPNLRGSGRVRDLREAAAQSPDVAAALQAYANAQTKEEQLALRDQLLRAWAGTDKRFTTEGVLEAASTKTFTMTNKGNAIPLTPSELKALGTIEGPDIWTLLGIEDPEKKKKAALREKIGILDAFTGTDSTHLYYGTKAQAQHTLDTIEKTYANLADNLYDGLLFQTRLKPYLDAIRFGMDDAGKLQLDYSGVAELFDEVHAKNPGKAFTDLGELLAKGNADGKNTDMALLAEKLVQYAQEASNNGTFEAYSNTLGKEALSVLGHSLGTDNNDTLRGNNSANYLHGGKGNDSLYGNEGKDTLNGGSGDDYLEGGDYGSDTYVFQAGHGKDLVAEIARGDEDADTLRFAGAKAGDVHFSRDGYNLVVNAYGDSNQVTLRRYFYNDDYRHFHFQFDDKALEMADIAKQVFAFNGTDSNDRLYGWITNDTIHGGDGDDSIYGYAGDDTLHGDAGNDLLNGDEGNDYLDGGTGDDTLKGGSGDDVLEGSEGNDSLYGNEGKDTLNGGSGDDYLEGGDYGSDTYVFQAEHGKDLVAEIARKDEEADTLRFEGAKAADARFSRDGYNLIVNAYGDSNQVTLRRYFYNDDYRHFHFQFDDAVFKATELRDIDLPTQGLKAPADATQAANMQTQTAAPAAENVQPEADAQKRIVAVDRARPAPQKVIAETALNTPQANADADVASDNSTAAADAVGNTVKNAATVAKPATVLAPAATSKKIWPATTIATDTQQASAATASVSGELSATAPQRTSLVTVQQNAIAAANALKTGSTTVTPATTLDAKAAQQSQQMLSAMAAHNQTATPTELAAPDLQPKPQLVANPV